MHEKVTDEGPAATDPAQLPQLEQNVKPTTGSNDDSENSKSGKVMFQIWMPQSSAAKGPSSPHTDHLCFRIGAMNVGWGG